MEFAAKYAYINPTELENIEELDEQEMENQMEQDNFEIESLNIQLQPQEEMKQQKPAKQTTSSSRGRGSTAKKTDFKTKISKAPVKQIQPAIPSAPNPGKMFKKIAQQGRVHRQAVDTNVISVMMNILMQQSSLATGDPVLCKGCESLLNSFSKLEQIDQDKYKWVCQFCLHQNQIELEEEEKPTDNQLTYILESPQQVLEKQVSGQDQKTIIFVIDTSGSMCVTQPISKKIKMRNDPMQALKNIAREGPQYMPGEKKQVTYVSRLQCVQAAIEQQLEVMSQSAPERRVGIITFSGDVLIIGDGTQVEQTITGDNLNDGEKLTQLVQQTHEKWLGTPIKDCSKTLIDKIWTLQESGPTALGPALLMAIELAGQGTSGSKVVICTDGIANVGLGNLEEEQEDFYMNCALVAKTKGLEISVISIEGQECKLESLIPLVEETQGGMTKVDPEKLDEQFANVLETPLIATHVKVTLTLHQFLTFRNEENLQQNGSRVIRDIGNAAEDTAITFEYTQKSNQELKDQNLLQSIQQQQAVPFQLTIDYRTMDGMRCIRVLTKQQQITQELQKAEQDLDLNVMSMNAQQKSANYAQKGLYREAQANSVAWGKYMSKNSKSNHQEESLRSFKQQANNLNNMLQLQQIQEMEEEVDFDYQSMNKEHLMKKRKAGRKDNLTLAIQSQKKAQKKSKQ